PSTLTIRMVQLVLVMTTPMSGSRSPSHPATADAARLKPISVISEVRSICRSSSSNWSCPLQRDVSALVQALNRSEKLTEPNISNSHTEYTTVSTINT